MARLTKFARNMRGLGLDEPTKPKHEPQVFLCIGCDGPGMFGEGVCQKKGEEGIWYCSSCAPPEVKNPKEYLDES